MVLMSQLLSGQSRLAGPRELGWLKWRVSEARANPSSNTQEHSHWCPGQGAQNQSRVTKVVLGKRRVSQVTNQEHLGPQGANEYSVRMEVRRCGPEETPRHLCAGVPWSICI